MINITIKKSKLNNLEKLSAFVSFNYDENLVNLMRSLPVRFYHKDTKEWEVPTDKIEYIKQNTSKTVKISGISKLNKKESNYIPKVFSFITQPYKHQIEGIKYGLSHTHWLLGDEMGCVSGDSKVRIKENRKSATRDIKIKYLTKAFETDNTIQIKCMVNGRFAYMPIKNVIDKGIKNTIRIDLEDTYIVCTPDHLIYTKDGWKEAGKLTITDEVFTNGKQVCPLCGTDNDLITYKYSKFLGYCRKCMYNQRDGKVFKGDGIHKRVDNDGYVRLFGKPTRKMPNYDRICGGIYEHHQVWYENTSHIVNTKYEVVHHINGIKTDNRFENLQLMTQKEHCKLHSDTKSNHLYQFNNNLDCVMRNGTKIQLVPRLQKVNSIKPDKTQSVYDIAIDSEEIHNFICNNIIIHNCGKTKQIIDLAICNKIIHNYKHCLIICGVNGLKWNWYYEVLKHSKEQAWILGQRTKNSKTTIKSNKEKLEDLQNINNINAYFIITNIESLRSNDITKELKKLCKNKTINMIAFDECHKCANPTSQQSKGLLELKAENQIAMSGTPLMNKPTDLYTPLKWLGYENHTFYQFQKHYCIYGGFGGYEVIGYKNLDELQEKLNKIMLRRLKNDVLDLPEKTYIDEYVELTPNQQKVYNEVYKEVKQNIDKIKVSPNPLAQLIRLRQAIGYTGILSSTIKESAKLDRLKELIEEHTQNNQKVVVFSNWTQMTDIIYSQLKKYNPALITGEINIDERKIQENKFQNDNACKVIIGTIGAMGTGLTLTAGEVVIFIDEPWTKANYEQAVDRCHRIGAKNNITIYNIIAKNTLDERIHQIVYKKGVLSNALVDGQIKGDKLEMLNYLLN